LQAGRLAWRGVHFKLKWTQDEKQHESESWHVRLKIGYQHHRIKCYTDHRASERYARNLEFLRNSVMSSWPLTAERHQWISTLPDAQRRTPADIGLLDSVHMAERKSLTVHVAEWR
jgi:hypothetical protein